MAKRQKRNTLTRRRPRKVVKTNKQTNRVAKDRQPGERSLQKSP